MYAPLPPPRATTTTVASRAHPLCVSNLFDQLSVLTRVSQMHEALASIVEACQESTEGSAPGMRADGKGQREEAGRAVGEGDPGGDRGVGPGNGSCAAEHGVEEGEGEAGGAGGSGATVQGKGELSAVTREQGAVIVERSRSCLRVRQAELTPRVYIRTGVGGLVRWKAAAFAGSPRRKHVVVSLVGAVFCRCVGVCGVLSWAAAASRAFSVRGKEAHGCGFFCG